jgi:hypothetical protein
LNFLPFNIYWYINFSFSSKGDASLLKSLEDQNFEQLHANYAHLLRIPRRPKSGSYHNADELNALESSQFLDWRRQLVKLSEVNCCKQI